jgi:hypothetical protein
VSLANVGHGYRIYQCFGLGAALPTNQNLVFRQRPRWNNSYPAFCKREVGKKLACPANRALPGESAILQKSKWRGTDMSKATEWLKARAPGFNQLSQDEQKAITDFSLLWSLFESRVLASDGCARVVCDAVAQWNNAGALDAALFDDELAYFKARYYAGNDFTYHFDNLHLGRSDRAPMVRAVLDGSDNDPQHRLATALIIVYRYRNNLFHGLKWQYELAGQLNNFNAANAILMKALDRYG